LQPFTDPPRRPRPWIQLNQASGDYSWSSGRASGQPVVAEQRLAVARNSLRQSARVIRFRLAAATGRRSGGRAAIDAAVAGRGAVDDDGAVAPTAAESAYNCVAERHLSLSCWTVSSSERRRRRRVESAG